MKTIKLLGVSAALLVGNTAMSQAPLKGVQFSKQSTSIQVVEFNPADPSEVTVKNDVRLENGRSYIGNTMFHVEERNAMYFFTQRNTNNGGFGMISNDPRMVIANAQTGKVMRELPFSNTSIMAPFVIPEKNQVGFIASQRNFNGYGNNEDDISLVIFNMSSGEIAHRVELPSLSFQGVSAPFVGKSKSTSPNGVASDVEVSVSSPCYIASKSKVVFVAKDVVGINRVYVFNTQSGVMESKLSIDVDVLDLKYNSITDNLDILYIVKSGNDRTLKLGVMTENGSAITEKAEIRKLNASEDAIQDGSVEVNHDNGSVVVTKDDQYGYQTVYNFDADLELKSANKVNSTEVKIDIAYPEMYSESSTVNLASAIKLFPNPATDKFSIATEFGVNVKEVVIYDNIGQVVKRVDVQSGSTLNEFNVDYLKPGIYFVDIVSEGAQKVSRKLVVQ